MKDQTACTAVQASLSSSPSFGSRWQHFGGGTYTVVMCAVDEATLTVSVVYRSDEKGWLWVRALSVWNEIVPWPDGSMRGRFMPVTA